MKNRSKIEKALLDMHLSAKGICYRNMRSSPVYGDSGPSGSWEVFLEDGRIYQSSPDYDTVAEAVDVMIETIKADTVELNWIRMEKTKGSVMDNTFKTISKPSELKMAMDVMQSQRRVEEMRSTLQNAIHTIKSKIGDIENAMSVEYTGWIGLFKEKNGQWECVATVDSCNLPEEWEDEMEPEWDMAVPIPKPGTVPDFQGW